MTSYFATAAKGTEPALRDELRSLRVPRVRADRGGVHFEGDLSHAAWVCIASRIAVRVLQPVASFEAPDAQRLYDPIHAIAWEQWVTGRHTMAVRATSRDSHLTHTQFIAQKTKDAIVDRVRAHTGTRPSVDLDDPDFGVFVHLVRDQATVYLDLSGSSLHKRGWRVDPGPAPLKETLACAVLWLSGWRPGVPLVDPMCGAGTLAIEAALWASGKAPALRRVDLGFERWADFTDASRATLTQVRERAKALVMEPAAPVLAADIEPECVSATLRNAAMAGVVVHARRGDVRSLTPAMLPEQPGVLVCNPPYGERLEGGVRLYDDMAAAFSKLDGWRIGILAGEPQIERAMRATGIATGAHGLFNGPIECRLLTWDLSKRS